MRSIVGISRLAFRSGLVGVAVLSMTAALFVGTANAARPHRSVAPLAVPRGFRVIRSVHNPDGTIAATLRSKSGARIYYLGRPGARISLVRHVTSKKDGRKTLWTMKYGVAVRTPSSSIRSTTARSARSEYSADATRGAFPESVTNAFVKDIKAAVSPSSIVGSTCISYFDDENVSVNGCDTRTGLQEKAGNSYLADDMLADIYVGSLLGIGLTRINDWMSYTSTTTNNIVNYDPKNAESTNCNSYGTWSATYLGIGFSAQLTLCGGTATPWGLNSYKGGSGWLGGGVGGALYDGTVQLEPILEDHNTYTPGHTNPTSTWHITTVSTAVTVDGSCPFSPNGSCG
jgi:hypothetical protein